MIKNNHGKQVSAIAESFLDEMLKRDARVNDMLEDWEGHERTPRSYHEDNTRGHALEALVKWVKARLVQIAPKEEG